MNYVIKNNSMGRVVLEKLIFSQLVKTFLAVYGI
jgi:hypothetical protein